MNTRPGRDTDRPITVRMRRPLLAVHIITSVAWIGAALAYLALGFAAGRDDQSAATRAAWIGMETIGWQVCIPLGVLAWSSGIGLSLITRWGLLRHYWVVFALVLTTVALAVMVLHMPSVSIAAAIARTGDDLAVGQLGSDVLHPAAGLVVLLVVAVINIYKPRGLTPLGQRAAGRPTATGRVG